MIIETATGRLYTVVPTDKEGLEHCWYGFPVRKVRGEYVVTPRGEGMQYRNSPELVRRAGCRTVEA
jgi:hypothetical protein